jgi:PAS domain S-box-containing protein
MLNLAYNCNRWLQIIFQNALNYTEGYKMQFYGNKLKQLRRLKKISSTRLAEILGVTRKTVSSWETGRSCPRYTDVKLICDVINIQMSEISDIKTSISENELIRFTEERKLNSDLKSLQELINLKILPEKNNASIVNLYKNADKFSKENVRLKNRLKRYESILGNIDPIVYVKNVNHTYKYVNDSFVCITGTEFTKEEIIGVNHSKLFERTDYIELLNLEKQVLSTGYRITDAKIKIPNSNGNQIGLVNIIPLFSDGKNRDLIEIVVTIKDITEISTAMDRQKQLKNAINSLNTMIYIRYKEDNSNYIYLSESCFNIYGRTSDEFLEDPGLWREVIPEEDRYKIAADIDEALRINKPVIYRIIHKNGSIRWVQRQLFSQSDRLGKNIIFGTVRDITETYLIQKDREEMERAVEMSKLVVWIGDTSLMKSPNTPFPLTYISDNIYEHLGIRKEDLLIDSSRWLDAVYENDLAKAIKFRELQQYPKDIDFRILTKEKNIKWINLKIDKKDNFIYGVIRDFTEAKKDEQERIELQEAINNSDSLIIVDRQLNIENKGSFYYAYIGDKIKSFWGISKNALKKNHSLWFESIIEEDRAKVVNSYNGKQCEIYNEYRVLGENNKIKWLSHRSIKKKHAVYSYISDITYQKTELNFSLSDSVKD